MNLKHGLRPWAKYTLMTVLCLIPAFYNSCQSAHQVVTDESALQSSNGGCDLKPFFERTFHPFLRTNCSTCHITGGIGKGAFADTDPGVAWNAFKLAGYSNISAHATDPAHQPPYTGGQHQTEMTALVGSWTRAEADSAQCSANPQLPDDGSVFIESQWFHTRSKALNLTRVGAVTIVSWDLAQDIRDTGLTIPTITGAKFNLRVRVNEVLNAPYYMVMEPTLDLTNANTDVILHGLKVKINGKYITNETTFTEMHAEFRRGEGRGIILSYGTISSLGTLKSTDVISVSFKRIEAVTLPPPPAPVTARFRASTFRPTAERGAYDVWVDLSAPVPDRAVVVGLEIPGSTTATAIRSGRVIRNFNGDDVEIDNFDWDYKINTLSMTFLPGATSQKVTITISNDDRYDLRAGNEDFIDLRIGNVAGAMVDTTRNTYRMTIPDDDPMPDPNRTVRTYSDLMDLTSGTLGHECIRCHNSVDRKGGYDVTNYEEMIANRVLIPGDVNSEMFVRMNVDQPGFPQMPFQGGLDTAERKKVENWIRAGAKND